MTTVDSISEPEASKSPKRKPESKDMRNTFCKLGYMADEKQLLPGITIRAATIEKLAMHTVQCIDEKGEVIGENEFPRVFFLMHQWFVSSQHLAQIFSDLYKNCASQVGCGEAGCNHASTQEDCPCQLYRTQVCHALRYWINTFPVHFDMDRELAGVVHNLQQDIHTDGNHGLKDLVDVSKVPSYDWVRHLSVRSHSHKHSRKVSLVFNHLTPAELAEQLTFLEYKAFRRITFLDFKHYATCASLKDNPRLERSIALFNGLSQWIQCMVLSKTTPQERSEVIVKFVDVAKRLRGLQNFNTLMAVIGGLTHSALARLSKTNACLPPETQKYLGEFTDLLSSSNNFSNYRRVLQQCQGFRIPILGVHMKDLILLHTALPDRVEHSLVNFRKMAQLSITFTELMQLQNAVPPVEPNMDLVNTLRLALDLQYSEDEIYELSLAREPRNSLSTPSTPTKPVVFAEWVAGVSPPDKETINKHVHDMVEAVFKNYDHDRDGFISHAEFEAIAGNYPFIDSFCVLDADQDGMISKAEMKTYFIRANCHALRNSFKHDFHETTYFKPTFCIHCTGLLWGLIKQGWKCRECGINAHKHCKDLVVMECRSKPALHGRPSGSSTNGGHSDLTLASKRKISQRQRKLYSTKATQTMECYFTPVKTPPSSPNVSCSQSQGCGSGGNSNGCGSPNVKKDKAGLKLHKHVEQKPGSPRINGKNESVQTNTGQRSPQPSTTSTSSSNSPKAHKTKAKVTFHTLPRRSSSKRESSCSSPQITESSPLLSQNQKEAEPRPDSPSSSSQSWCKDSTCCDEQEDSQQSEVLVDQLNKAEEVQELSSVRDKLLAENIQLRHKVDNQSEQISTLKSHIGIIRQHTITFILDQMDTLHMQRDTEV